MRPAAPSVLFLCVAATSCTHGLGANSPCATQAAAVDSLGVYQALATQWDGGVTWAWGSPRSDTWATAGVVLADDAGPPPNDDVGRQWLRLQDADGGVWAVEHNLAGWPGATAGQHLSIAQNGGTTVSDENQRTLLFWGSSMSSTSALQLPPELSVSQGSASCAQESNCGTTTYHAARVTAEGVTSEIPPGQDSVVGAWRVRATYQQHDAQGTTCPTPLLPGLVFRAYRR